MPTLDLLFLIPIALGAYKGYKKGLLIEVLGILAFIAAIVIGFKFLYLGANFVEDIIGLEKVKWLSPYMSFFVVFLPSLFILRQLSFYMKKAIRLTFLGTLDGVFGAALGALTTTFALSILLWIINKIGIPISKDAILESNFYDYVSHFAPNIIAIVSDILPGGNWFDYLDTLKHKLKS